MRHYRTIKTYNKEKTKTNLLLSMTWVIFFAGGEWGKGPFSVKCIDLSSEFWEGKFNYEDVASSK